MADGIPTELYGSMKLSNWLVVEDRVCPQAEKMEKESLEFCEQKFDKKKGEGCGGNTQGNNAAASEVMDSLLVEAA